MTEEDKQKRADEYNRLLKLANRERNDPHGSTAMVASYEASMARIEDWFQRADADISDYI